MDHDVKAVTPLQDFTLQVELVDGRQGVFDLKPHLHLAGLAPLREAGYFKQVTILFGAVTWPGGEDISPDTLVAELKAVASA